MVIILSRNYVAVTLSPSQLGGGDAVTDVVCLSVFLFLSRITLRMDCHEVGEYKGDGSEREELITFWKPKFTVSDRTSAPVAGCMARTLLGGMRSSECCVAIIIFSRKDTMNRETITLIRSIQVQVI